MRHNLDEKHLALGRRGHQQRLLELLQSAPLRMVIDSFVAFKPQIN